MSPDRVSSSSTATTTSADAPLPHLVEEKDHLAYTALESAAFALSSDLRLLLSHSRTHCAAHCASTANHCELYLDAVSAYCNAVDECLAKFAMLEQRVFAIARFADDLNALAKRTMALREKADALERRCVDRGIVGASKNKTPTSTPRNNNNSTSPFSPVLLSRLFLRNDDEERTNRDVR